jgi:hypothetical protein
MARIILVGAGFSYNWGGWLAEEVMGDLYGRLADDVDLSGLIGYADNFEDALSHVQEQYKQDPSNANRARLESMQAIVIATFRAMNEAFATRPSMEFSNQRRFSIIDFLARFDAIFTLNQDLLLELHYNIELHEPRRWNGHHFPGMLPPAGWQNARGASLCDRLAMVWRPADDFRVERNLQPIYKLHGSANWQAGERGELLVLGGSKALTIAENRILNWYADEFRRYLEMPGTRLMVIGYGFRDEHIDQLLYESWRRSGFRMFVVNPQGRRVLQRETNLGFRLLNQLQKISLVGESMRPLSTTFNGDALEHGKLLRFFD